MTLETILLIDFPKVKEIIKQRPTMAFYKDYFQKVFVKLIDRSALKYSKCNSSEYFENECLKVWRPIKRDWAKTIFNTKSP